jgi:hypothetical protein
MPAHMIKYCPFAQDNCFSYGARIQLNIGLVVIINDSLSESVKYIVYIMNLLNLRWGVYG